MKRVNYKKVSLFILILFLLSIYIIRFTTVFDEDYSLTLVHNTYFNIIKFDSLDVHPPLFYILLKLFLQITTFWTNSLLVKIIFSRVFSVIISIITFIFLVKIIKITSFTINYLKEWLIFLIIPGVILFTYELIKIRMYSLSAMFVVIGMYELVKFKYNYKNFNLIIATLMAILSSYTHYYSAIISGLILVFYIFNFLLNNDNRWKKITVSLIIFIVCFVPWLPIVLKQFSMQKYHPLSGFLYQWLATLVLIIMFIPTLFWSYRHLNNKFNNLFICSFSVILSLFIFSTLFSIIDQSIFQFRYFYPIFLIYGFLGNNVMLLMCRSYKWYISNYSKIFFIVIFMCSIGAYISQINFYNKPFISTYREFRKWKKINHNQTVNFDLTNRCNYDTEFEKFLYLTNINKHFHFVKGSTIPSNIYEIQHNPSYKLMFKDLNNHIKR